MNAVETAIGIKGMKSVVTGGASSFFFGWVSIFATTAIISDIAACIGIISGIATLFYIMANTRKVNKEAWKIDLETDLLFRACNDCTKPELCPFKQEHRPKHCKHKTST